MTTPREHAELAAQQSVTDELRLAAKSAAPYLTAMISVSHLNEAADTIDTLRAEKDRLTACLEKANASAEHFEREWYLRGDELDNLRAQLAEAQRDAERYRSLRRGQKWSVIDWKGDALRADDLDAAIDAAKGESNG